MADIADVALDDIHVGVVLREEFAAVIEDVIDRDLVTPVEQLRRQHAAAITGATRYQ